MGNVLKFGQSILGEWDLWADVLGRSCGLTVGFSWSLTWASLINGPVMAAKLKEVPLKSKASLDSFLASPADGVKLKALLTAEALELLGIRSSIPAPAAAASGFVMMSFDEDEIVVPAAAPLIDPAAVALAAVTAAEAEVLQLSFPEVPDGDAARAKKIIKRFEKKLLVKPTAWKDALTTLATVDAAAAAAYVQQGVVSHIKSLKRKLREVQTVDS